MLSHLVGSAILPAYLIAVISIGWASRRRHAQAREFLVANRSMPLWVVVASFLSANCGALEIVGLSAVAAQYGVQAFHFYWIGAIPGMIFLGGVMLPIYMRSGVQSLPEYLEKRFDARVRLINSWLILLASSALSGIGLYAIAQMLHVVYGWSFGGGAVLAAGIVLIYVSLGGLRATLYNQVLQLAIILLGLLPLFVLTLAGSHGLVFPAHAPPSTSHALHPLGSGQAHLWQDLHFWSVSSSLDLFGVVFGLGFVLSFSYWCTDFVQMQRALTARTIAEGRMVPLLAGFGKLFFSLLVVVPALSAASVLGKHIPASFDQTLPALMAASYGPVLLGLGVTALMASLMSHLAGNVSAFSALWTEEIYRVSLCRNASEAHYMRVGRASIVVAIVLSVANSYLAFHFRDLMEYVQMVFSFFGAPFFATFLIGIFTRQATAGGAVRGMFCGVFVAVAHQLLFMLQGTLGGSQMNVNFHGAAYAFLTSLGVGLLCSRKAERKNPEQLAGLVYQLQPTTARASATWWMTASLLLAVCVALNYLWR